MTIGQLSGSGNTRTESVRTLTSVITRTDNCVGKVTKNGERGLPGLLPRGWNSSGKTPWNMQKRCEVDNQTLFN